MRGVLEALTLLASASLRYLPTLVLVWLAVFFGRTRLIDNVQLG